jgi:long-chain acyl-CoA synthetase
MLDNPQNTLPDIWTGHARLAPSKLAIRCGGTAITWGEFGEWMNRVGHVLSSFGVRKGDRIATVMSNTVDHLVLLCGAMKFGACVTPISTLLSPGQIATLINDSGSVLLFTDSAFHDIIAEIEARLDALGRDRIVSDCRSDRWLALPDLLAAVSVGELNVRLELDDLINISYSSGTTGVPKGVVYSHRARHHMAMTYAIAMRFGPTAKTLVATPIYSNGTWITLWPALLTGGEIVIMPAFDPRICLETVEREAITHTFMVPTQYIKLLDQELFGEFDLSSLRMCLTAGSTMSVEVKKKVISALGPRLYELYGFSEGGATIITPEEMAIRPSSVGRPTPGFEIRILSSADSELSRNEPGEIAFWGGWVMRGYHNNPEQTRLAIWRDEQGRTFIRTGDIGRLDEDGYLYVVDRKKDMIISGGFNVYPADIEAVLGQHPDVLEAAVIGVPHRVWGETPFAFVILKHGAISQPVDLVSWANTRLAKTQRLSGLLQLEEFPRNALGKVVKRDLRDRAVASVRDDEDQSLVS